MPDLKLTIEIDAPAEVVWDLVGTRFGELSAWANPVYASSMLEPDLRQCLTSLGRVHERLLTFDAEGRTLTYEATVRPPWMKRGLNRFAVIPVGERRCRVESRATIEVHPWAMLRMFGQLPRLVRMSRTSDDLKVYAETGMPSARKQAAIEEARHLPVEGSAPTPTHPAAWGLRANVVYSVLTGAALALDVGDVALHLGLPPELTRVVGIGLIGFAGLVGLVARRVRPWQVLAISAADLTWVAGSAIWVTLRPDLLGLVGGAALGVLAVAIAQLWGVRAGQRRPAAR